MVPDDRGQHHYSLPVVRIRATTDFQRASVSGLHTTTCMSVLGTNSLVYLVG